MKNEIPEVNIYSDGGADPNPGKGGFGVIMTYKEYRKEFNQGYLLTTNNRMELMGVIFGLEKLKTKSIVNIFTDSLYVVNGITKGWAKEWKSKNWYRTKNKLAINHDLWDKLLNLISAQQEVKFYWIKGHAGHPENERCDELANIALNNNNLLEDLGYYPVKDSINSAETTCFQEHSKNAKIENEGDLCGKCGAKVIKKPTKNKKIKPNQTYYFDYYLYCQNCKTMYMVEDAKRTIDGYKNKLFDQML